MPLDLSSKSKAELDVLEENARRQLEGSRAAAARSLLDAVTVERSRRAPPPSPARQRRMKVTGTDAIIARMVPLGLADRVRAAFTEHPPNAEELSCLRAVHARPGASTEELSEAAGKSGSWFNMAFGSLSREREPWLGAAPPSNLNPSQPFQSGRLIQQFEETDAGTARRWAGWYLRPEAVEGLRAAGILGGEEAP